MKLKILVFDDDENIRNLLKTALESKGHEVTALADPTELIFRPTELPLPSRRALCRRPDCGYRHAKN